MSYKITSQNCKGRKIDFIIQDGEFLSKGIGREFVGTLVLQDRFENGTTFRLFFADNINVGFGLFSKIGKIAKAIMDENSIDAYRAGKDDYLCCFEFTLEELKNEIKKIEYIVQPPYYQGLFCYDLKNGGGFSYLFNNIEEADQFANFLGLEPNIL
ncbi:MAG: hypothetical protein IKA17_01960 [Clostridia bacterium]|nr:hypothetical protein [Clostridia bacterium]